MPAWRTSWIIAIFLLPMLTPRPSPAEWRPVEGRLATRWSADVDPDHVLPEYPRPQMVRREWLNLNGLWQYSVRPSGETPPDTWDGEILVPFPIESSLSGVMRRVGDAEQLWYRREIEVPSEWKPRRVLLHFGAVDWETTVWVNGREVGTHRGGYDPFWFDITSALSDRKKLQEVLVRVADPTDGGTQPRGKQVREPEGIWYTPTTGIWQTVWMEPVHEGGVNGLRITPNVDDQLVQVEIDLGGMKSNKNRPLVDVEVMDADQIIAKKSGDATQPLSIALPNPRLWSPDDPYLYGLKIRVHAAGGAVTDDVDSYFGMRKVSLARDDAGIQRIMLNNRPLFMFGPLDQGFWPDGLYTAPTDEALKYDIELTRDLGYNMARKHVKVEPARWYHWCDKLGLLVWQDMPNGDAHVGPGNGEITRSSASAEQYELELEALIDTHVNHPSIVMWVPFNEGWGQYDTRRIADWIRSYDKTRLVNSASGWNDVPGAGDVHDIHMYPGPGSPPREADRALVLGEFGGLGLPVPGHTWQDEKNWGYRSYTSESELLEAYVLLMHKLRPLVADPGLSAAVYTQTTDVEIEVNGLVTYDREVLKLDRERVRAAHRLLYLPQPTIREVVATADDEGFNWRYTTEEPPEDWTAPEFDDALWNEGPSGFGTQGTPGSAVRTEWSTNDIWLRRTFELPAEARIEDLQLMVHHDEDAEIYINGELAVRLTGYTVNYFAAPLRPAARAALKQGTNVVAVHCHQTGGGQYIDVGLVEILEAPEH